MGCHVIALAAASVVSAFALGDDPRPTLNEPGQNFSDSVQRSPAVAAPSGSGASNVRSSDAARGELDPRTIVPNVQIGAPDASGASSNTGATNRTGTTSVNAAGNSPTTAPSITGTPNSGNNTTTGNGIGSTVPPGTGTLSAPSTPVLSAPSDTLQRFPNTGGTGQIPVQPAAPQAGNQAVPAGSTLNNTNDTLLNDGSNTTTGTNTTGTGATAGTTGTTAAGTAGATAGSTNSSNSSSDTLLDNTGRSTLEDRETLGSGNGAGLPQFPGPNGGVGMQPLNSTNQPNSIDRSGGTINSRNGQAAGGMPAGGGARTGGGTTSGGR